MPRGTAMTAPLHRFTILTALLALSTAACDAGPGDDAAEPHRGTGQGGPWNNTNVIAGSDVPAADTTGALLGAVRLTGVTVLDGTQWVPIGLSSLHVTEGTLRGARGADIYIGEDFEHSRWDFEVQGSPLTAWLQVVESSFDAGLWSPGSGPDIRRLDPDRLVYTFQYLDPVKQVPISTCAEDTVAGARMVLYGDIAVDTSTGDITPRDHTIYFGCLSGAVGKAALWGYAPDSPSDPQLALDEFETAVRTVRADYCGDGTSYTIPGKRLTLDDRWGFNQHGQISYTTEAIWEAGGGALCVNRVRTSGKTLTTDLVCPSGEVVPRCGTDDVTMWNDGDGILWTKIPPALVLALSP
jgi:hypothetical protein